MKKNLFLALCLIAFQFSVFSSQLMAETIPATDSRVTFVGRTAVEGTTVSFDWTATYFRVAFAGLTKKNVARGKYRFLTPKEVAMLQMGAFE